MRRLATLAALAVLLPAHVAIAQTQGASSASGPISQSLVSNSIAAVTLDEAAQAGGAGSGGYTPKVYGGVWLGDNSQGFAVGGGVSAHPFTDERHEIQGNAHFLRVEGSNGFGIDADYYFNFVDNKLGTFTPFVGGGLVITHFGGECIDTVIGEICGGGGTNTNLQIGGGITRVNANGRGIAVRGQFIIDDYSAFLATLELLLAKR
jgi:hypothetical protein